METRSAEISARWARICASPIAKIAVALSGVSVTFAPLFLYYYGQGMKPLGPIWIGMPICVVLILGPGLFHLKLAHHVMKQLALAEQSNAPENHRASRG